MSIRDPIKNSALILVAIFSTGCTSDQDILKDDLVQTFGAQGESISANDLDSFVSNSDTPFHLHEDDVEWGDYSAYYSPEMIKGVRAKRLMGPGGAMPQDDMLLGIIELDPGGHYPPHRHDAPEAYYVTEGEAECQFGDERFTATRGTVIYTQPGKVHSFRNTGKGKFVAVGFWWAPQGDIHKLLGSLELTDE